MFRVLIAALFLLTSTLSPALATVKRYNGESWVDCTVKRYNGASWDTVTVKRYSGSEWVELGSGGGSVTFTDTFTGTDGTLLENHTADTGQTWTQVVGTMKIISNAAGDNTDVNSIPIYTVDIADLGDDYTVSANIYAYGATTTFSNMMIGARYNSANGNGYFARISPTAGAFQIYKYYLGAATLLISSPITWAQGTTYAVTLTVDGNQISGSVDGVSIGPYTDSTNPITSGVVWLRSYSTAAGVLTTILDMEVTNEGF